MRRLSIILISLLVLLTIAAGCGKTEEKAATAGAQADEKIKAVATFYPLYEFTRQVGGDRVQVENLTPAGVEPHEWEPTPRDMARVEGADLLVCNGAGFETWLGSQYHMEALRAKGISVVEAAGELKLIDVTASAETHHHEEEAEAAHDVGHDHDHTGLAGDPHIWLDPTLAIHIVDDIKTALIEIDPAGSDYYRSRAAAYRHELEALDRDYAEAVNTFKSKEIVTSHDAFAYLARRYGLQQRAVLGLSTESEPTPARMKDIIQFCRDNQVKYIFFETLANPKLAQTLAREIGAKTLVLDPIEGLTPEQEAQGEDYISIMRQNLANLKLALGGS